jgi:hypothetical protein
MVQRNLLRPLARFLAIALGFAGFDKTPLPLRTVQVPVPYIGVLPGRTIVSTHIDLSDIRVALVGL